MKSKKIRIYVDMDDVLCDFMGAYHEAIKRQPQIVYPQSQYGFFRNLEPIDGAKSIFKLLSKYFDVWILTAPSIYNPMCYTEKREWVETHLGFDVVERLIISPNKSLLIGDYLIDDIAEGKAKQEAFQGTLIQFGSDEFPDWLSVLE